MARKYSRDNRGRFASSGTGATARGGRLRTATGNKRATQTSQMAAAPRAGTVGKGGKARGSGKPAATVKPTQAPGSRIKAPKVGSVSRARLSGQKMNEGAGKRGKARQQRQQTMAIQRQMLGRVKPGKRAEPLSTGGTLAARASLRRARAKAGPGASPAQRGAVKRAGTYLKASKERNRAAVKGAASRGTVAKPKGLKQGAVTARVKARAVKRSKPDLSQSSFERRARATEKRAKNAEQAVGAVDRYNPANRRLVNRANSLRSAADSYASYARRGKNNPDFSAADLFKRRSKSSTAPKLTPSEKAAVTRRAKADKRFKENVRRMEQDRRR